MQATWGQKKVRLAALETQLDAMLALLRQLEARTPGPPALQVLPAEM